MAMTPKSWGLTSYSNDTWTTLVGEPATLASVIVSAVPAATVQMRVEDTATNVATLLPPALMETNSAYTLDMRALILTGTQTLQIRVDMAGVEFYASGAVSV